MFHLCLLTTNAINQHWNTVLIRGRKYILSQPLNFLHPCEWLRGFANYIIIIITRNIYRPIHSSFSAFLRVSLRGQQLQQGDPQVSFHNHILQLLWEASKVFPGQPKDTRPLHPSSKLQNQLSLTCLWVGKTHFVCRAALLFSTQGPGQTFSQRGIRQILWDWSEVSSRRKALRQQRCPFTSTILLPKGGCCASKPHRWFWGAVVRGSQKVRPSI